MNEFSKLFRAAFISTLESLFLHGRVGRKNEDGSIDIEVAGKVQTIYVRIGSGREITGLLEAVNLSAPLLAGTPVKLIKLARVWIVWSVDESSPFYRDIHYNVAPHSHAPGSGLEYEDTSGIFGGMTDAQITKLVTTIGELKVAVDDLEARVTDLENP